MNETPKRKNAFYLEVPRTELAFVVKCKVCSDIYKFDSLAGEIFNILLFKNGEVLLNSTGAPILTL